MKTAFIVFGFIAAFVLGLLVGLRLDQPGRYQVVSLLEGKKSVLDTKKGRIWDVKSEPLFGPGFTGWKTMPTYSQAEFDKMFSFVRANKAKEFGIDTTIKVPPDSEEAELDKLLGKRADEIRKDPVGYQRRRRKNWYGDIGWWWCEEYADSLLRARHK